MSWIVKFPLICIGAIAVLVSIAWALGDVTEGLSTHGVVALVLGILFTVGVAVGLMALTFLRNHDEDQRHRRSLAAPD